MRRSLLPLSLLATLAFFPACGKSGEDGSPAASAGKSGVTMVLVLNKPEGGEQNTQSGSTVEGVSLAQVEEKFKAYPWSDAQYSPHVGLAREEANGISSLKIGRPKNAQNSASMQALWMTREPAPVYRLSEEFTSQDQGLKLLRAFFNKDPSLSSLAQWTQVQE